MFRGLNADSGDYPEEGYVKCRRCGFMCNTYRDKHANPGSREGWGTVMTTLTVGTAGRSIYDPVVTSGCPQCGTLLYNS